MLVPVDIAAQPGHAVQLDRAIDVGLEVEPRGRDIADQLAAYRFQAVGRGTVDLQRAAIQDADTAAAFAIARRGRLDARRRPRARPRRRPRAGPCPPPRAPLAPAG